MPSDSKYMFSNPFLPNAPRHPMTRHDSMSELERVDWGAENPDDPVEDPALFGPWPPSFEGSEPESEEKEDDWKFLQWCTKFYASRAANDCRMDLENRKKLRKKLRKKTELAKYEAELRAEYATATAEQHAAGVRLRKAEDQAAAAEDRAATAWLLLQNCSKSRNGHLEVLQWARANGYPE